MADKLQLFESAPGQKRRFHGRPVISGLRDASKAALSVDRRVFASMRSTVASRDRPSRESIVKGAEELHPRWQNQNRFSPYQRVQ
jgi:hypothetical protein